MFRNFIWNMPLPNLIVGCDDHIATRIFLYYLSNFYPHHRKRSPLPLQPGEAWNASADFKFNHKIYVLLLGRCGHRPLRNVLLSNFVVGYRPLRNVLYRTSSQGAMPTLCRGSLINLNFGIEKIFCHPCRAPMLKLTHSHGRYVPIYRPAFCL